MPKTSIVSLLALFASLLQGCAARSGTAPSNDATAAAADRRSAVELVELGRRSASRGDAVRAEQYLALAIEQGADKRQVMPILLRACLKSSHLRAALNHAEPYLLEYPDDDALRYLVATIHVSLGQEVNARRELGMLLMRDAHDADAHYLLGILDSAHDFASAKAHFGEALEYGDDERRIEVRSRLAELQIREAQSSVASSEATPVGGQP